jgi:hypothetical protein
MNKFARTIQIRKLKKALERMAFISLIADIAISIVTLISLKVGQSYTVGILFVINYLLTIIVIISLILIFSIAILSQHEKLSKVLSFFRFWNKR